MKTATKYLLSLIACIFISGTALAQVTILEHTDSSFELQTGDYIVKYAPLKAKNNEGWVTITEKSKPQYAIATKLANGVDYDVTDAGAGEGEIYGWKDQRKDSKIFRTLTVNETADIIEIRIDSKRQWADFDSTITAYKKYPGLIHWTVTANALTDKAFSHGVEPDCFFMADNTATMPYQEVISHETVRYMTHRGPAAGIVYFRDLPMDTLVFYFQDFSSLNDLYKLTGADNPYDYPPAGNPGSVKLGDAEAFFQQAGDGTQYVAPKPYAHDVKRYSKFGYHRPACYRVPKGKSLVVSDTYLYLKPAPQDNTDNVKICKNFVEMLADIYQYIYKPQMTTVNWSKDVVPALCSDIMRKENHSMLDGNFYPKAYVDYEHEDKQLWTVAQLLCPLTEYVKKYPNQKAPNELKRRLDKTLLSFYDEDYKGFNNNLPPLQRDMFFHTVYIINPAIMVADLAIQGNKDAEYMINGFKPRLLQMGKTCGYVFGDVWFDDFSKMNGYYQFDATGAYIYIMMSLYELSGSTDTDCLEAAKAAAEKLTNRCFDLGWQINMTAAGFVGCEKLYQATGNERYRDIMYIPLANSLQQAWLWECDYGFGEKATTFWAFCGTPAAPSSAEYETHRARLHFKQLCELAADSLGKEVTGIINDAWKYGPTQSLFTLPPFIKKAKATKYIAQEGKLQTNCGEIRYDQMIPLEDFNAGWGTDLEWWNNNSKSGVVGQEIYGAGGPIWYAVWQEQISK